MTATWPEDWAQVSRGDRVFIIELYADGWHVITGLSTACIIVGTREAAIAAVDKIDAKIRGGGGDGR
jgi:hypothetical protein